MKRITLAVGLLLAGTNAAGPSERPPLMRLSLGSDQIRVSNWSPALGGDVNNRAACAPVRPAFPLVP